MSPQARREQVAHACERGLSQRRACGLIGLARSGLRYELRLPSKDAPVIAAMKDVAFIKDPDGYWIELVQPNLLGQLGLPRA